MYNKENRYKDVSPFKYFLDDTGKLRGILYQDYEMRRAWEFYGDNLLMDATFGTVQKVSHFIIYW